MPSVARVLHEGLAADKPVADATLNQGWLYYETDTGMLKQSWNSSWVTINTPEAAPKIDEKIAGPGGLSSADFTGIVAGFTNLRIIGHVRGDAAASDVDVFLTFNGDAGANYDYEGIYGVGGGGPGNYEGLAQTGAIGGKMSAASAPAGAADMLDILIPSYAGTAFQKTLSAIFGTKLGTSANQVQDNSALSWWRSTAAITRITLTPSSGKFAEGSTISLYGTG